MRRARVWGFSRVLPAVALVLAMLFAFRPATASAGVGDEAADVRVSVTRKGDLVRAKATFTVPLTAPQAYAVLTDYDRMREFLPDVIESRVIERAPGRLVVSQKVRMKVGFLSIPLESVRQVELDPPTRLVSRALSGTVSSAQVTTTLREAQGSTLVSYDSEAALSSWMPAGLGANLIQAHIHAQLIHMRAEMLRRDAAHSTSN